MSASTFSIHRNVLRSGLSAALVISALSVLGIRAHAAELDPITVSAPMVTTAGHDFAIDAPIEKVTVQAHIAADTETLRNDSGVALLKDRVAEAARKACAAADPSELVDDTCVFQAIKAAQPQVDAAIARARSSSITE